VFDAAEEIFDQVSPPVHGKVTRNGCRAIGFGGDHREDPPLVEFHAQPVVVEGLVADQGPDSDAFEQWLDADAVVALTRQEQKAREIAQRIDQSDDFGR
jgi:hypothetical protein